MTVKVLQLEMTPDAGFVRVSEHYASYGFLPAFFDFATATVYRSRFANGHLAPFHLLDGLPEQVVVERDALGRVVSAKPSLIPGFERNGYYYTLTAAARAVDEWSAAPA